MNIHVSAGYAVACRGFTPLPSIEVFVPAKATSFKHRPQSVSGAAGGRIELLAVSELGNYILYIYMIHIYIYYKYTHLITFTHTYYIHIIYNNNIYIMHVNVYIQMAIGKRWYSVGIGGTSNSKTNPMLAWAFHGFCWQARTTRARIRWCAGARPQTMSGRAALSRRVQGSTVRW